jgi:3-methylcrotonyl-CoA carboxylase alpha subunit
VYGLPPHVTFERAPAGVRVDSGVREGDTISPFYDSMVAKLIVHGATREEALARMDAALAQTHIVGLTTNVQFLRHVVTSASFAKADLDTGLIPREAAVLFNQEKVGLPMAAAAMVAHTLLSEQAAAARPDANGWNDPWAQRDGWKSHGPSLRPFSVEFQGAPHTVVLTTLHGASELTRQLQVDGLTAPLRYAVAPGQAMDVHFGENRALVHLYKKGEVAHVFTAQGATQVIAIDALAHAGDTHGEAGRLTAPMPGKVVSFAVKAGDKVKKGQPLAVMDAMKMEHTIAAPADGTVAELLFAPGDQVADGAELLRMEVAA